MEKTTWNKASTVLRAELEALLQAPNDAFHSDYLDAVAWWLLLLLVSVGGAAAAIWNIATSSIELGFLGEYLAANPVSGFLALLRTPHYSGLIAALIIAPWTALTWIRNVGRRGLAVTSQAIVVMRGPKLLVIPYAAVASATQNTIRTRKQTFTVVELKFKDGSKRTLYATGRWAALAMARLPVAPG